MALFIKHIRSYYAIKTVSSPADLAHKFLVGFGNPLLDMTAYVDDSFLAKHDLKKDTAIMAGGKHKSLFKTVMNKYNVKYSAGGSVQNTLRACQWMLQRPRSTVFFGGVGRDICSEILEKTATKDGVTCRYQYISGAPTGTCIALVNGSTRTLIAKLGAAEYFSIGHVREEYNWNLIERAKYIYSSGYFLIVSLETLLAVAQRALLDNSHFFFNLSAAFVPHFYMNKLRQIIPYTDVIFCNEMEALAFAETEGWKTTDRKIIGRNLQGMVKLNPTRPRVVIITQNMAPVLVIGENSIMEVEVPRIANEKIVDTTGAGDSFAGGFIAEHMQNRLLEDCVRCGIYLAQYTIQHDGVYFLGSPNYTRY